MSCHCHCDCQESTGDEATVAEDHKLDALIKEKILCNKEQPATVTEKPDGLLITTMVAITAGIFLVYGQ